VSKRLGLLLGGSFLGWALLAYPAYLLGGEVTLAYSAFALGLCLVPALVTMVGAEFAFRQSPEMYLLLVLGGTGLRLFVVLGVTLAVTSNQPYFQQGGFLSWVLVFYLLTLALETILLLAGRTKPGQPLQNK
jgi:hypothetical protein